MYMIYNNTTDEEILNRIETREEAEKELKYYACEYRNPERDDIVIVEY